MIIEEVSFDFRLDFASVSLRFLYDSALINMITSQFILNLYYLTSTVHLVVTFRPNQFEFFFNFLSFFLTKPLAGTAAVHVLCLALFTYFVCATFVATALIGFVPLKRLTYDSLKLDIPRPFPLLWLHSPWSLCTYKNRSCLWPQI